MTQLVLPRFGDRVVDEGGTMTRSWRKFMNEMLAALGFSASVPLFSTVTLDLLIADKQIVVLGAIEAARLAFNKDEGAHGALELPNNYCEGTDVQMCLVWATDGTQSTNLVLQLEHSFAPIDAVLAPAALEQKTVAGTGTAYKVTRTEFTAIVGTTLKPGSWILIRASRDGGNAADTNGNHGILLGVTLRYRARAVGTVEALP